MVDAGDQLFSSFQPVFHPQPGKKSLRAHLDAVAETDGTDPG